MWVDTTNNENKNENKQYNFQKYIFLFSLNKIIKDYLAECDLSKSGLDNN